MKVNFITIILFAFGFTTLYSLGEYVSNDNIGFTDIALSVSNLNQDNYKYIKKDFNKVNGIIFCDISLSSNMICLRINDNKISNSTIGNILRKWGCRIKQSSINKIVTLN